MHRLLWISIFVSVLKLSIGQVVPYKEEYFDQTFDHFNFASFKDRTFKQRYLVQGKSA